MFLNALYGSNAHGILQCFTTPATTRAYTPPPWKKEGSCDRPNLFEEFSVLAVFPWLMRYINLIFFPESCSPPFFKEGLGVVKHAVYKVIW